MTTITLLNWFLIIASIHYGVIGILYVVRFFIDLRLMSDNFKSNQVAIKANEASIEANEAVTKRLKDTELV